MLKKYTVFIDAIFKCLTMSLLDRLISFYAMMK
jgi:hypothetical protein